MSSHGTDEVPQGGTKRHIVLSPAATRLLSDLSRREERLAAARGNLPLHRDELITVLCMLAGSGEPELRDTALSSLKKTGEDDLTAFLMEPDRHPRILDLIARLHGDNVALAEMIFWHPTVLESTREYLSRRQNRELFRSGDDLGAEVADVDDASEEDEAASAEVSQSGTPATEEYRTAYKAAKDMTIGQKIKMALTGDKEWRTLLVKDTIKPVCCAVLKNPRITEIEVLTIARSVVQYDDIIRLICMNREWVKKYPIRKALVQNHRTPLPVALKLLGTLTEKDLAFLGKSKNVSTVIAGQARKLLMAKATR